MFKKISFLFLFFSLLVGPVFAQTKVPAKSVTTDVSAFGGVIPSSATNVQAALNAIAGALDTMSYEAPVITSFINNRNDVEIGTVINSTTLNWAISKAVSSITLNQGIGSVPSESTSKVDTTTYSTTRTYTLTVSDGTNGDSKSSPVTFKYKRYWLVSNLDSLNTAQILALAVSGSGGGSELATNNDKNFTLSPSNQHMYYITAASFGPTTFTVYGFSDSDWDLNLQSFTNESGATFNINVYKKNLLTTGTNVPIGAQ